jgi:phosphatidylserine decarboxylase
VEAAAVGVVALAVAALAYVFWRHVWFWRNPQRNPPSNEGLLSAADGVVVYVRKLTAAEDVIHVKRGLAARLADIVREDIELPKLIIGVFMSPFDVHYNRAPLSATIDFIRRHPAIGGNNAHMGAMHWRTVFNVAPHYAGSVHIVQNERTVTHFVGDHRGAPLSCYVVQIGARTVNGIDSYYSEGQRVERSATFGMIRIGSQVDLVVPWRAGLETHILPGTRVRAGETILIE